MKEILPKQDNNPPDSLDHGDQVLAELRRGGERHEDLVLPAVGRDLGDLDEPAAKVARWQNLIQGKKGIPRPPPWHNPRKGRDQILQRSVAEL